MIDWEADFKKKCKELESWKEDSIKRSITEEDKSLFFYKAGMKLQREHFKYIITDMKSSLSRALLHLKHIFGKYKNTQANASEFNQTVLKHEQLKLDDMIKNIEGKSKEGLKKFRASDLGDKSDM